MLLPLIRQYYELNYEYKNKVDAVKMLKNKFNYTKRIKLIKFKAGYHRLSTYLLTILSYMSYLQKIGFNINVVIKNSKKMKFGGARLIPINKNRNRLKIQNVPRFKNRFGHANFVIGKKIKKPNNNKMQKHIASERLIVILNKVPNIDVVFSLLNTFKSFPIEINKVSINADKNINIIFNLKLINLRGFYR